MTSFPYSLAYHTVFLMWSRRALTGSCTTSRCFAKASDPAAASQTIHFFFRLIHSARLSSNQASRTDLVLSRLFPLGCQLAAYASRFDCSVRARLAPRLLGLALFGWVGFRLPRGRSKRFLFFLIPSFTGFACRDRGSLSIVGANDEVEKKWGG